MRKQIERINKFDELIKEKKTGSPDESSELLGISKRQFYRMIALMIKMNAPIKYDKKIKSYVYEKEGTWQFGFKSSDES